jgi:signal transduction histidine kinase
VVITLLREGEDEDSDGIAPPQPGLADLGRLVEESRMAGTAVHLHEELSHPDALPATTGRTVYRVVQEGLTNARKHARGQAVEVNLEGGPGGRLSLDMTNRLPASGLAGSVTPGTGTGLIGLAERVDLAGGQLHHEQTAAGEFRLHAWLPWPA